jgi:hypothetical protein
MSGFSKKFFLTKPKSFENLNKTYMNTRKKIIEKLNEVIFFENYLNTVEYRFT